MSESHRSSETPISTRLSIEIEGFDRNEIVTMPELHADLFNAFNFLGKATKPIVQERIEQAKKGPNYEERILKASKSLEDLINLSRNFKGTFTTHDGVNHLERYVNALMWFNTGSGVPRDQLALLQVEDQTGCQTLLVQNIHTKEVVGLHMEEDGREIDGEKKPTWGKKWMEIKMDGKKISFCSYGGVLSFGTTSGIVETRDGIFFQAADSLNPTPEGKLWANALAFMTMDCADIGQVRELVENINGNLHNLPKPLFLGGYILHMVQSKNGKNPEMLSLEFGGDVIKIIEPLKTEDRLVAAGVNLPLSSELEEVDFYNLSQQEDEALEEYAERKEEKRILGKRHRRLSWIGKFIGEREREDSAGWGESDSIKTIKYVLRNKHGEWLDKWLSGFSNHLVAQHDFFHLSPQGKMKFIVRKGSPNQYKI